MTITSGVTLADGQLFVRHKRVLSGVPENVLLTSASGIGHADGVFIGALCSETNSRHVVPLGTLENVRFLACFRFKLWWMSQKMGSSGKEIPMETQFLLLENKADEEGEETIYTVFLPLVEGSFRACLQGNENDALELCLESGDPAVEELSFTHSLLINAGTDPFKVITDGIKSVELHLQTFRHREEKKMPGIVDWFGWCTWDAFYTAVSAEGVEQGLKRKPYFNLKSLHFDYELGVSLVYNMLLSKIIWQFARMYAEAIDIGALTEVGLQTHAMNRRLLQTIESVNPDCNAACGERCKEASRQNVCLRACGTCCAKCNCVPPGTYGNQDLCACYASMKTHDNKPKCP